MGTLTPQKVTNTTNQGSPGPPAAELVVKACARCSLGQKVGWIRGKLEGAGQCVPPRMASPKGSTCGGQAVATSLCFQAFALQELTWSLSPGSRDN